MSPGQRFLIVTADDLGIGPGTTRGILDLAARGVVTCSVLLANSPHTAGAARAWARAGRIPELGWHPCLTLDRPVLPPARVSSLVGPGGRFHGLGRQVRGLLLGRARESEVEAELRAQLRRFTDLTGGPPAVVNAHHHLHVFGAVARPLLRVLGELSPRPYLRRVREPWSVLARLPGTRGKRALLSLLGRRAAARQALLGFPGNDWLAGVSDAPRAGDEEYFTRWLVRMPGRVVELMCHPGHGDASLAGRDALDGRPRELELLQRPAFRATVSRAGFTLVAPSALRRLQGARHADAA